MQMFVFLLLSALSLSPDAPEARTARAGVNNDGSQVVCRQEREIGSRVRSKRVCRTREEWATFRRETRSQVERAQNNTQTHGQ